MMVPKVISTDAEQSLDYNVPGGKLNRGMSVVDTLTILKGSELTENEYYRAAILGWCIELVRTSSHSSFTSLSAHTYTHSSKPTSSSPTT
jgi:geranylgeranyl pyrophosphate synthase